MQVALEGLGRDDANLHITFEPSEQLLGQDAQHVGQDGVLNSIQGPAQFPGRFPAGFLGFTWTLSLISLFLGRFPIPLCLRHKGNSTFKILDKQNENSERPYVVGWGWGWGEGGVN